MECLSINATDADFTELRIFRGDKAKHVVVCDCRSYLHGYHANDGLCHPLDSIGYSSLLGLPTGSLIV